MGRNFPRDLEALLHCAELRRFAVPPSLQPRLARPERSGRCRRCAPSAALWFALSACNNVSGHFADDTRFLLGLMQWN